MVATLTFYYGPMYAGKSSALLAKAAQYELAERETQTFVASPDAPAGPHPGRPLRGTLRSVTSRAEGTRPRSAVVIGPEPGGSSVLASIREAGTYPSHVFVDEAQFLSRESVKWLKHAVDMLGVDVSCFGLRTDFRGELFDGSALLFACADRLVELKGLCAHSAANGTPCTYPATMNLRLDRKGAAVVDECALQVDTSSVYSSVCRAHHTWALRPKFDYETCRVSPKRARDDGDDGNCSDGSDEVVETVVTVKTVKTVKTVTTVVAAEPAAADQVDEAQRAEELAAHGECADCGQPDTGYCQCTA